MINDYLKTLPQYLLPKKGLTTLAGCLAEVESPAIKNWLIKSFIHHFKVNMTEAVKESPEDYRTFNEFFIRHLKPEARKQGNADILSPVDGCISELGMIEQGMLLQAKQHYYSVEDLLACSPSQSQVFTQGLFTTLYLSPKDYHRIHMPIRGQLQQMIHVPGQLFSVQPATVRIIPNLFARNQRLVLFFETAAGPLAVILVGATIVGGIGTAWAGELKRNAKSEVFDYRTNPITLEKGEELGYFKLGSTVIMLFADRTRVQWLANWKAGDPVQWGQDFGEFIKE